MMVFGGSKRQRQMFANQFESVGAGFLYRKHSIGRPIRVSIDERARFVADFEKFTRQSFLGMVAGALLLFCVFMGYWYATGKTIPDMIFYAGFGAMLVLYMMASFRAWNRPSRELSDRSNPS